MGSREGRSRPLPDTGARRASRATSALLVCAAVLAAGAGGYLYALGQAPPGPSATAPGPSAPAAAACDCARDAGSARSDAVPAPAQPQTRAAEIEAPRFAVCAREETPAQLALLALNADRPPLLALHCGRSVHLLALRQLASRLVPERVAVIDLPPPGPAETNASTEVVAADLDGDGRLDVLVPSLLVDRSGAPSGGSVMWLRQRREGGLVAPVRLFDAAPAALAAFALDANQGQDLVVLQRQDASNARSDELWLVRGGPAPLRVGRLPAGVGAAALSALDLDLDGADDLAVGSLRDGKLRLFLSRRGPLAQTAPIEIELPGIQNGLVAELDGDGHRDLLLETSAGAVAIVARAELGAQPPLVAAAAGLRDLSVMNINSDDRPDILGYAHPEIILLSQGKDFEFERQPFASLRGAAAVLHVELTTLDSDPRPDAVVITVSDNHVELAVARNLEPGSMIRLTETEVLLDAAWLERFTSQ